MRYFENAKGPSSYKQVFSYKYLKNFWKIKNMQWYRIKLEHVKNLNFFDQKASLLVIVSISVSLSN